MAAGYGQGSGVGGGYVTVIPDDQFNLKTLVGKDAIVAKSRDREGNEMLKTIAPATPDAVRFGTEEEALAKLTALGIDPKTVRIMSVRTLPKQEE